jgi:hypothetical protein
MGNTFFKAQMQAQMKSQNNGACFFDLRFALCALRFALCALRFALCALRFALCALRFALCAFIAFALHVIRTRL